MLTRRQRPIDPDLTDAEAAELALLQSLQFHCDWVALHLGIQARAVGRVLADLSEWYDPDRRSSIDDCVPARLGADAFAEVLACDGGDHD